LQARKGGLLEQLQALREEGELDPVDADMADEEVLEAAEAKELEAEVQAELSLGEPEDGEESWTFSESDLRELGAWWANCSCAVVVAEQLLQSSCCRAVAALHSRCRCTAASAAAALLRLRLRLLLLPLLCGLLQLLLYSSCSAQLTIALHG
jgi:hypothetical protein